MIPGAWFDVDPHAVKCNTLYGFLTRPIEETSELGVVSRAKTSPGRMLHKPHADPRMTVGATDRGEPG